MTPCRSVRCVWPRRRLASQFAWFLPLAVLGLVLVRRRDRGRASLTLWGAWALTYGIVYSAAGGIFHLYYLSTLAPPFAALAGIGAVQLWRRGPRWLAAGLVAVALWQGYVLAAGALGWEIALDGGDPWPPCSLQPRPCGVTSARRQ